MQGHKDLETHALRADGQAQENTAYLPGPLARHYLY